MPIKKKPTAVKKPALGPKATLMKLAVTTLRSKAKRLGISDVTKRSKENLAVSIMLAEARKKRGTTAGKKATAKRTASSDRQTGSSNISRDLRKQAFAPGRRTSASGNVYYERRKNRSDKPGQLMGEKYNGWTNYWTWKWNLEMVNEEYLREEAEQYNDPYKFAKFIKSEAEDFVYENMNEPFESWIMSILEEINWTEIASHYIEE